MTSSHHEHALSQRPGSQVNYNKHLSTANLTTHYTFTFDPSPPPRESRVRFLQQKTPKLKRAHTRQRDFGNKHAGFLLGNGDVCTRRQSLNTAVDRAPWIITLFLERHIAVESFCDVRGTARRSLSAGPTAPGAYCNQLQSSFTFGFNTIIGSTF
ncbi:hypothetical protein F2P81_009366 [Scophthalmus maximus]|uniref:Uncharacterized protein n=1 Tax=Scophthalmus maximus TaxID=52904 RepID=A0A6A4T9Q7_SCOMX|nr:hypothetical protein F2P81_009366 [Scophthalmus maximus]